LINFDHKLIAGKGVCVCFVNVAKLVEDQKGSKSGFFLLDQFALGDNAANAANENKRRDLISFRKSIFTAQQQWYSVKSCRNAYNRNCKARCVNNLKIV